MNAHYIKCVERVVECESFSRRERRGAQRSGESSAPRSSRSGHSRRTEPAADRPANLLDRRAPSSCTLNTEHLIYYIQTGSLHQSVKNEWNNLCYFSSMQSNECLYIKLAAHLDSNKCCFHFSCPFLLDAPRSEQYKIKKFNSIQIELISK